MKPWILLLALTLSAQASTYYINGTKGSDSSPGNSEEKAWKTIERINKQDLKPGDSVLFAAGQTFKGTLALAKDESGSKGNPILISSYGDDVATIDADKRSGIRGDGACHVKIAGLKLIGCGRKNGNNGCGITWQNGANIEIDAIDVSGFRLCGVQVSKVKHARITRVHAYDNGFAGIAVGHGKWSEDVYIGHCRAVNNPGDPKNKTNHSGNGIVVGRVKGCLIEYCVATENGWDMPRKGNGPVGIWAWDADRVTIQHCISYNNKTSKGGHDGGGFDLDGGVTNSVVQHCLAYGNASGGFYICQYPSAAPFRNNIFRANISIDNRRGFMSWAAKGESIGNTTFENNLIVQRQYGSTFESYNGRAKDVANILLKNNIFVSRQIVITGPLKGIRFEGNRYWHVGDGALTFGKQSSLEGWAKATGQEMKNGKLLGTFADPGIEIPKKLPTSPAELKDFPLFKLLK